MEHGCLWRAIAAIGQNQFLEAYCPYEEYEVGLECVAYLTYLFNDVVHISLDDLLSFAV